MLGIKKKTTELEHFHLAYNGDKEVQRQRAKVKKENIQKEVEKSEKMGYNWELVTTRERQYSFSN